MYNNRWRVKVQRIGCVQKNTITSKKSTMIEQNRTGPRSHRTLFSGFYHLALGHAGAVARKISGLSVRFLNESRKLSRVAARVFLAGSPSELIYEDSRGRRFPAAVVPSHRHPVSTNRRRHRTILSSCREPGIPALCSKRPSYGSRRFGSAEFVNAPNDFCCGETTATLWSRNYGYLPTADNQNESYRDNGKRELLYNVRTDHIEL